MYACYDKIIGISNQDCACTAEDRPADYDESKSGLFLSDLAPVSRLLGTETCEKTAWEIAGNAITRAVDLFVANSNALLGKKYKLKRKIATKQVLGQIKAKDVLSVGKNYAVVTLECAPVRGGLLKLRTLGGIFAGTGDVTVELRNNVDEDPLGTYTLSTTPNRHVTTPVNLELPLYSKYADLLQYYLVYTYDANNAPKANLLDCGCGGFTPVFDRNNPHYNHVGAHKRAPWADYLMAGGREINSLSELEDTPTRMGRYMYGLTLEVDLGCKVDEVLCEDALDFTSNPLALSIALAIQYKAAALLADEILRSPLLNRENMVNREEWEEDALVWTEKYNDHVNYIVDEADRTANDCLACKDVLGFTRKGLFS